jgi:hypothetical protein
VRRFFRPGLKKPKLLLPGGTFCHFCKQRKTFGESQAATSDVNYCLIRAFRYCEQKAKFVSMEAKIMSNVPGWQAGKSVYHSERCTIPSIFIPALCFMILGRWVPYFEGSQRAKATPGW